jgi:hypothetical protein
VHLPADKSIEDLQEEVTNALTAATPSKGKGGGPVDEKAMQRLNVNLPPTLDTTRGQIDGFFSQHLFKCYLPEVASVGD